MYGDRGGTPAGYAHRKVRYPTYEETISGYDDDFLRYQLKAVLSYDFTEKAEVIRAEMTRRGLAEDEPA